MFYAETTGLIFTKIAHDIVALEAPFLNDRAICAGGMQFCSIFATKLVAMATSLKISEKEGRIDHRPFNIYHTVQRL